jgi:hypothetical protein
MDALLLLERLHARLDAKARSRSGDEKDAP